MFHLSKAMRRITHFWICLVFPNYFQYNRKTIIEKSRTVLLPDLWFLSCNKKFENSMILRELEFPKCDEIKQSQGIEYLTFCQ